jgi:hypothetical protein
MRPEATEKGPTPVGWATAVERQTYTIEEAAKILGICRAVAYRRGVLPTVKIAGRRLVPKQALERMLAETA